MPNFFSNNSTIYSRCDGVIWEVLDAGLPGVVAGVVDVEDGAAVLVAGVAAVDHLVAALLERDAESVVAREVLAGTLEWF